MLDDARAAAAETLIAADLAGKTPGQVAAMIARAVVTVDPDGAARRRERAQEEDARVRFWREHAGTAALAAFGLPPDEALAASQHIQDRALAYKAAGVPGTLDQLRVRAFLDALNGTTSLPAPGPAPAQDHADQDGGGGTGGTSKDDGGENGGGSRPGGGSGPGGTGGPGTGEAGGAGLAAATMLTIPLATLLGLAQRPGDACGLGAIDPGLARQLAAAAACHHRSTWCVTVTDERGHAIGHAVPYAKGGKTCSCNGGCRCRRDHQVKQSPGWTVTQPRPGYHQWATPAGRTFTSEPMRYPI